MQPLKLLTILGALLLLSSCSRPTKEIEVLETKVRTPILAPTLPKAVDPMPIKFKVVNEENLQAFLEEIRKKENVLVFIGMTVKDYEALAVNTQELIRYIKQQKEIIVYYQNMTKE